jgi:hypothetical protein
MLPSNHPNHSIAIAAHTAHELLESPIGKIGVFVRQRRIGIGSIVANPMVLIKYIIPHFIGIFEVDFGFFAKGSFHQ